MNEKEELKSAYYSGWVNAINYVIKHELFIEPKIIRCEDCKWCEEHYDTDGNAPYWICKNWNGGTDADGFCHEAERKIDE